MKKSPRNVVNNNELCKLNTDNKHTHNYWILLNENYVAIAEQKKGEECKKMIKIDKGQFNKLIDWYNKEQIIN